MKTISIESLAEKLGQTVWEKGNTKRIYLNDYGHNTKKMSTKTYLYEHEGRIKVSCRIECSNQHDNWIEKEQDGIIEQLNNRIAEIVEEFGVEVVDPKIAINEALAAEEQVQGYYMCWHLVRVAINSYGKLAYRKRQKVHTYQGPISKKPNGFISLNDDDFAVARELELKERLYEYGEEPKLVGEAKKIEDRKNAEAQRMQEQEQQRARQQEEKKKTEVEIANQILESENPLMKWKELGFPMPAPGIVVQAKTASGLSWSDFKNNIKHATQNS